MYMKGALNTYQKQNNEQERIRELHEENERLKQELEESKREIEELESWIRCTREW